MLLHLSISVICGRVQFFVAHAARKSKNSGSWRLRRCLEFGLWNMDSTEHFCLSGFGLDIMTYPYESYDALLFHNLLCWISWQNKQAHTIFISTASMTQRDEISFSFFECIF